MSGACSGGKYLIVTSCVLPATLQHVVNVHVGFLIDAPQTSMQVREFLDAFPDHMLGFLPPLTLLRVEDCP